MNGRMRLADVRDERRGTGEPRVVQDDGPVVEQEHARERVGVGANRDEQQRPESQPPDAQHETWGQ